MNELNIKVLGTSSYVVEECLDIVLVGPAEQKVNVPPPGHVTNVELKCWMGNYFSRFI